MNWDSSIDIVTCLRALLARIRGLIRGWNNRCFSSPESHSRGVPAWVTETTTTLSHPDD